MGLYRQHLFIVLVINDSISFFIKLYLYETSSSIIFWAGCVIEPLSLIRFSKWVLGLSNISWTDDDVIEMLKER